MALNFFRFRKGMDLADQNVIFTVGDVDPYSVQGSTIEITNADLTASGIGSEYTNKTNGDVWRKTASGSDDITDWSLVASSGGATEDGYQNTFMGKTSTGSETPTYSSTFVVTTGQSLESEIGALDAEIGAGITGQVTRTNNNPISDQAINTNIKALDSAIGNDVVPIARTNNPIANSNDIGANLEAVDKAIGTDAQISNTNYITVNSTVNEKVSTLDGQVKTNANSIAAIQVGLRPREAVKLITGDDISAKSGTAVTFTDNDGVSLTLSVGDRIASVNAASDDNIYIVQSGAWTQDSNALVADDAFWCRYDFTSPIYEEGSSLYRYTGTTNEKVVDIDFENANSISLTGSYTAGSGNVDGSDTIEAAIQKVDGNVDALTTTMGVSQGDTNLGAIGGGTGADEILTDTETAKSAVTKLGDEIGVAIADTTWTKGIEGAETAVLSDQAVNLNIDKLAEGMSQVNINRSYTGTPTGVALDTVTVSDANSGVDTVEWMIRVHNTTNSKKYACKIFALADQGSTAIDFTENTVLRIGADITGLVFDVTIVGSTVTLEVTSTEAVEIKAKRVTL